MKTSRPGMRSLPKKPTSHCRSSRRRSPARRPRRPRRRAGRTAVPPALRTLGAEHRPAVPPARHRLLGVAPGARMYARAALAVPSGAASGPRPWWRKEYISFSTTSVASPMARTKRLVGSRYGVRTSRKAMEAHRARVDLLDAVPSPDFVGEHVVHAFYGAQRGHGKRKAQAYGPPDGGGSSAGERILRARRGACRGAPGGGPASRPRSHMSEAPVEGAPVGRTTVRARPPGPCRVRRAAWAIGRRDATARARDGPRCPPRRISRGSPTTNRTTPSRSASSRTGREERLAVPAVERAARVRHRSELVVHGDADAHGPEVERACASRAPFTGARLPRPGAPRQGLAKHPFERDASPALDPPRPGGHKLGPSASHDPAARRKKA